MPSNAEKLRRAERALQRGLVRVVTTRALATEARHDARFLTLRVAAARRRRRRSKVR